jgi:hypothetical protein
MGGTEQRPKGTTTCACQMVRKAQKENFASRTLQNLLLQLTQIFPSPCFKLCFTLSLVVFFFCSLCSHLLSIHSPPFAHQQSSSPPRLRASATSMLIYIGILSCFSSLCCSEKYVLSERQLSFLRRGCSFRCKPSSSSRDDPSFGVGISSTSITCFYLLSSPPLGVCC